MAATIILITLVALSTVLSIWFLIKRHTSSQQNSGKKCYTIEPEHGSSTMVRDSNYIIGRIGHFVGEGSKEGLNNVDIRVDLRYTQASSLYKAIGALESEDAIKVSEKQKSPSSVTLNIAWTKLPGSAS